MSVFNTILAASMPILYIMANLANHGASEAAKLQNKTCSADSDSEYTVAEEIGMSVVGKSEVAVGRKRKTDLSSRGGLFSGFSGMESEV